MAKFKLPKVGDICVAQDAAGTQFKVQVIEIRSGVYPIIVKVLDSKVMIKGDGYSDTFYEGQQLSFSNDGYLVNSKPEYVRLVKVKTPWKEFTEDMKLTLGMKVRIKQGDKKYDGKVTTIGEASLYVKFAEANVIFPDGTSSDYGTICYHENGKFVWFGGAHEEIDVAKKLRIRWYK